MGQLLTRTVRNVMGIALADLQLKIFKKSIQ